MFTLVVALRATRDEGMGVTPVQEVAGRVTASTVLILPIMLMVDRRRDLPAPPSATGRARFRRFAE